MGSVALEKLPDGSEQEPRDMRLDFINTTPLRNDIEVFKFRPDAPSFGKGGAKIISVVLADAAGKPLSWVIGGENVRLIIRCLAKTDLHSPIVGFIVKDRLGQALFSDNTLLTYRLTPLTVLSGQALEARFDFRMPLLPVGDYSISVAIAEGNQENHIQHQWIHDVLMFKSHSSSISTGLIGIPMRSIIMSVIKLRCRSEK